ncbi:MAG TPA: DUF4920 domain-containing protein [Myxococcaceae bacterium]|nr:DUF4920 domain-containing protein [Myxococcaceae bacterium]
MLPPMYPHVFTSLLMVTLATPALAHDDKAACDDDHARAAAQTAGALKPGAVLVRGDPLPKNQAPLPLTAVLNKPEDGKKVLVEGVVRRACSQMGCWMELAPAEGGPGVRVTFKDYGFFVPTDSGGAKARVQGTVKVTQLSAAQAEHLRAEGGSMPAGAQREVRLVATGVELRR